MEIKALEGQSLFDIAIQYTGESKTAIDIAKANGMDVTDTLSVGMLIIVPDDVVKNKKIVNYYSVKKITPATAVKTDIESDRIFGIELPEQLS
ncbi:MAG: LysM peptidoglycan-binding domain-containing protein [Dysgonamonadaceae bacterium]|jgi:hypothetical protein|nr:LysM peptidoglycan-binding domain-containing protein [Dysgonamonadaceae bacterium]